jgi:hypothetical protein
MHLASFNGYEGNLIQIIINNLGGKLLFVSYILIGLEVPKSTF